MANSQNELIAEKMQSVEKDGKRVQLMTIILSIISIVVAIPISIVVVRRILKSIQSFGSHVSKVADGDFTSKLETNMNDELGELGQSINSMSDKLQVAMRDIISSSERIAATSEEIAAGSNEISTANVQVSESIQGISVDAEKQSSEISGDNAVIADILNEINHVTASVEAFNTLTTDATNRAKTGHGYVDKVMNQMNTISSKTEHITKVIHSLDEKSNQIGNMIILITNIAEQTNLLALMLLSKLREQESMEKDLRLWLMK